MARNSGGTHSLPAGNPVVSGTTASSTTQNNTNSDISSELTDSLSRSGKGAMLAPLELTDGSVALPSLSFDSDPDCGLYRIGANNIGVAVNGAKVVDVAAAGVGVTGTLSATGVTSLANGAVGTPAVNFTSDPDSGMYRIGANNIGVAVNGAKVLDVATTGLGVTGQISATTGSIAGNVALTGSNPSSTTGFSNTVTPASLVKARGFLSGGGLGAQTVSGGFNIASVSLVDDTIDHLLVTFATAMADANYTVVCNSDVDAYKPFVFGRVAGSFKIGLKALVTPWSAQAYTQFSSSTFDFIVVGAQ